MNALQAAALRILESTPRERIRVHEAKLRDGYQTGCRPVKETLARHEQVMALHAKGLTSKEIAVVLEVSRMTVDRHIRGQVRAVQKAKQK